jgi:hypothetical protein
MYFWLAKQTYLSAVILCSIGGTLVGVFAQHICEIVRPFAVATENGATVVEDSVVSYPAPDHFLPILCLRCLSRHIGHQAIESLCFLL